MFQISPSGDQAIRVQVGNEISPSINAKIRSLVTYLSSQKIDGVVEWIPTYTALTIIYNPIQVSYRNLEKKLQSVSELLKTTEQNEAEVIEIPVYYGEEHGPDLNYVADYNRLTIEEVIDIHTKPYYLVYMIGFTPGFPYLGGMSHKLSTPRRENPRKKVNSGAVGIAGEQTGVYPLATPGGWQIIGNTPIDLYHPKREHPVLLEAGNYIKFKPISNEQYQEIRELEQSNQYKVNRSIIDSV